MTVEWILEGASKDENEYQHYTNRKNSRIPVYKSYMYSGDKVIASYEMNATSRPVLNIHAHSNEEKAKAELKDIISLIRENQKISCPPPPPVLLGDLNIDWSNEQNRIWLAKLLKKNGFSVDDCQFENEAKRIRSEMPEFNQQLHKGGKPGTACKNCIIALSLKKENFSDISSKIEDGFDRNRTKTRPEMNENGLDHNLVSLALDNQLYISVSNLATMQNGEKPVNHVIYNDDLDEEEKDKLLENSQNFSYEIIRSLQTIFECENISKPNAFVNPLKKALIDLYNKTPEANLKATLLRYCMNFFNNVTKSEPFEKWKEENVSKIFSQEKLNPETMKTNVRKNFDEAIKKIITELNTDIANVKSDRIVTHLLEAISPQPYNGYVPPKHFSNVAAMEEIRIADIMKIIDLSHSEIVDVFLNDTITKDYENFPKLCEKNIQNYFPSKKMANKRENSPGGILSFWKKAFSPPAYEEDEKYSEDYSF